MVTATIREHQHARGRRGCHEELDHASADFGEHGARGFLGSRGSTEGCEKGSRGERGEDQWRDIRDILAVSSGYALHRGAHHTTVSVATATILTARLSTHLEGKPVGEPAESKEREPDFRWG